MEIFRYQRRSPCICFVIAAGLVLILLSINTKVVLAQQGRMSGIRVIALDKADQPVAGVGVELKLKGVVLNTVTTNESGVAEFKDVAPGTYDLVVAGEGFETLRQSDIVVAAGASLEVRFSLIPKIELREGIEVRSDGTGSPVEQGASTSTDFQRQQLYTMASRPANVADTLPLVPGVTRSPTGEINMSGSGEHRSALVVNSADVTDPATGQFGMTIPVDSVEKIEVFKSPFLAQYGRFTAGVVTVDTRRGTDKWSFDIHDPLPAFRFRSGRLAGMLNMSPRVVFNGPLIKNRLYLSEGVEYRLFKDPVMTLPHPNRETKTESVNSFTQLDYIVSGTHTLTGTVHIAPRKILYANLNFFDPRPVSPNFSSRDYTGTLIDRMGFGSNLLESTLAYKTYGSNIWAQGAEQMIMTPTGNRGNYFNEQDRNARRFEWIEQLTMRPLIGRGTHNLRFGSSVTNTHNEGRFTGRPIDIENTAGQLLERIEFAGGRPYDLSDLELSFYAQDQWVINPQFALNMGSRFERQRVSGAFRVAPRFGFSWTPFGANHTVLRGGAGVFYDRVPLSVYALDSYPQRLITTFGPDGQIADGPRQFINRIVPVTDSGFRFIKESKNNNNFAPHSTTWSIEAEQPIAKFARIKANYTQSNSSGLMIVNPGRSGDQDALLLQGDGSSKYRQLELSAKVVWGEESNLLFSYVRSRARGDLNEFNTYLGNFPSPVVRSNQYSNLAPDLPHRFLAYGLIKFPREIRLSPMIEYRNGLPFAAIDASQQFVGVPNSDRTRFPNFYSLDLRISKDVPVKFRGKTYNLRVSFYGYNVTNHFNPWDVHRNIDDPQFGVFFGKYRRWFKFDFEVFF